MGGEGGLKLLASFSLMDFADASKIFHHGITKLFMQGLTAATLKHMQLF